MSSNQYIQSLELTNFTVLPNDTFEFSENLNVIVAENGCGKTHLLKILYSLLEVTSNTKNRLLKTELQKSFADKLLNVFRPDSLGRLSKRLQGRGRTEIVLKLQNGTTHSSLNFSSNSSSQVNVQSIGLKENEYTPTPIFLPSRELITLCPWFTSLYQNQSIPFEETWFDACMQLNHPLAKGPRETKIRELLEPIENAMGGKVSEEQGRFYLSMTNTGGKIEAPLVAEGLRKFVMIARLIATGALLDKGYLFWDEPEANLNPKLIKVAARIIWSLSQQGIQVFIATHSLFLLRELELLKLENNTDLPVRFFSLIASDDGTKVEQGNSINDLNTLILLDENIMQADRYLNI